MKKQVDLLNDSIKKLFFAYLIPSVSGTLVTSIYILVDTIMIGKGISNHAVAGLNIILPLYTLVIGTGLLFGVGGSVLMSYFKGKSDEENAIKSYSTALGLTFIAMLIFMMIIGAFFNPLIGFLGATPNTISYVRAYGYIFIMGIPFFMFSAFFQTFIRNDKAAKLAMIGVVTGGIINIILDYYFIFILNWGMAGAALATVIGNGITCMILLMHFITKKNTLRFKLNHISVTKMGDIFKNGLSTFFNEISLGIVIFAFNIQLLRYVGDIGVTVYSIISNTAAMATSLSNGISQAVQPIASVNLGAQKMDRIKSLKKLGLTTAFILGFGFYITGRVFPEWIINIFLHPTEEIVLLGTDAITIFFISFIGLAGNIFLNNYYQSIIQPQKALLISLLRGLILSLSFVFILPAFLGIKGIWFAMPLAEMMTLMIALKLDKIDLNKKGGFVKLETM
ncbi:putative MATE family efflux protein [Natranaerovirga hydrolytica]|uniref:Multidrug export protein MepA n=1 Tax=Natranaerovirga hydrolytica TaxID=680378 RepID=A0A4R1MRW3_9FIRM|nr:MATE family efflux transporter [Natranaerovirga hydrolytica]TCK93309.1 putative MATE family efflux protein [Natranaerovirga hydrolytica]